MGEIAPINDGLRLAGMAVLGGGGAVGTAYLAVRWVMRNIRNDAVQLRADESLSASLKTAEQQRDAAIARADALQQQVVELLVEMGNLKAEMAESRAEVSIMRERLGLPPRELPP